MRRDQSFAWVAGFDLVMVAFVGVGAAWIYADRVPSTTALGYVTLALAFCAVSLVASWLAWRVRLSRPLGPFVSVPFWLVAMVIVCAVPLMAVGLSERLGL